MAGILLLGETHRLIPENRGTRQKYGFYTGDRIGRALTEVAGPKSMGIVGERNAVQLNKS
jgi:hypothetical protein